MAICGDANGVSRRVRYADHPDGFCDVHGDADRRALVLHGGFWRDRYDLTLMDGLCEDLAARGWEAWNAEYRRLGHGHGWPEMSADVRAAAQLARADVAIGHSAGGHLALWVAAEGLVARAVGQAPVSDLVAAAALSGSAAVELGAPVPEASPRQRVPFGRPQLLVHGTLDENVPVQMSRDYAAAAPDEVTYVERPGEGHFEHLDPRSGAWQDVIAWL
jgi:acetyl esterase/lipase